MGWSYGANPAGSALDAVRVKIGDTDPTAQLLADEVILYVLDQHGQNVARAAVELMWSIAASLFRNISKAVGPLRLEKQQAYEHAVQLAQQLETEAAGGRVAVSPQFAGAPDANPFFTRRGLLDGPPLTEALS